MKLYVTDQISISAVQAETLRPGESFETTDKQGDDLIKALPNHLSKTAPRSKAEPVLENKGEPAPVDKASGPKGKGK